MSSGWRLALLVALMPSLHRRLRSPYLHAAFSDPDGRRVMRSTRPGVVAPHCYSHCNGKTPARPLERKLLPRHRRTKKRGLPEGPQPSVRSARRFRRTRSRNCKGDRKRDRLLMAQDVGFASRDIDGKVNSSQRDAKEWRPFTGLRGRKKKVERIAPRRKVPIAK